MLRELYEKERAEVLAAACAAAYAALPPRPSRAGKISEKNKKPDKVHIPAAGSKRKPKASSAAAGSFASLRDANDIFSV